MKNILLILVFFLISLSAFSQIEKEQFLNLNTFKLEYSFLDLKNTNFNYSNIIASKKSLFIYNKDLKINEVYSYNNNSLNYTSSKIIFSTNHITHDVFSSNRIDSFNPNGANNFKEAVLFGLINTIFK